MRSARLCDAMGLAEYEAIEAFRMLEPEAYAGGVADVSKPAARMEG